MGKLIPFNMPYVPEESRKYVLEALESKHQQGDGPFTAKASKLVSDLVGGGHVLLTPSCTHALEMASMLANIGPGDEVILPSYTFTSAATAITKFGATPVFVDIEMDTKGIDVNQVRDAITSRTKAISWVNYAGVAPDIEGLQSLAKEFNLLLIEDNAHGLGGTYNGKLLGSFGDFATQSFHATKNIQCGEGGALVVNNKEYIDRAEIIREKGTDRTKFIRGEVQKYQWVDEGSSYLLSDSQAGVLLGQLENFDRIHTARMKIHREYFSSLGDWALELGFGIFSPKPLDFHTAHMFYLMIEPPSLRDLIVSRLSERDIQTTFHYQSLVESKYIKQKGAAKFTHTKSKSISTSIIRLPIYFSLDFDSQIKVIDTIKELRI